MLHSLNYVTTDFLVFLLFIYTQQYQISILDGSKYLSVETPGSLNSYTKQPQNNHAFSLSLSLSLSLSGMIHAHFFLRTDSVYANL